MDNINKHISELKNDSASIKQEVREKSLGYITAALGLVAGLAWNEAIKGLIDRFFPVTAGGLLVKFAYAVLITLLVIIVGYYLVKAGKRTQDDAPKQ